METQANGLTEAEANARVGAKDSVELLQLAIQQLIEKKRDDEDGCVLLSRLLLQLESLKDTTELPEPSSETKEPISAECFEVSDKDETPIHGMPEMRTEEIVRELQKLKRQNSITHWLLSALIVITAVWQLSEVSLIMMMKNKVSHPFRAVGNMIRGALKGGENDNDSMRISLSSSKRSQSEALRPPPLKMPELPRVDLQYLTRNGDVD